jgi:hypothetical protein
MSHPERLLRALDDGLDHPVRLIIYGRGAIWLGFQNPPAAAATTHSEMKMIELPELRAEFEIAKPIVIKLALVDA